MNQAFSGSGDGQHLPDVDHAGVTDGIPVGLVDHSPASAGAVHLIGDVPQAVSRLHGVGLGLGNRLLRRLLRGSLGLYRVVLSQVRLRAVTSSAVRPASSI